MMKSCFWPLIDHISYYYQKYVYDKYKQKAGGGGGDLEHEAATGDDQELELAKLPSLKILAQKFKRFTLLP